MSVEQVMVSIPTNQLLAGTVVPVDIFIKLPSNRFIKVVKAQARDQLERFRKYEAKSIDFLYVRGDEYSFYTTQSIEILNLVLNSDKCDDDLKFKTLLKTFCSVQVELDSLGIRASHINHARRVAKLAAQNIQSVKLSQLLNLLHSMPDPQIRHAIGVCMVAIMMAHHLGLNKEDVIEKLSIAALLHDISLKNAPKNLLVLEYEELSPWERREYEQHPKRSAEVLNGLNFIPTESVQAVLEHHERADGSGFPRALRDVQITSLGRILSVSDAFIDLTLQGAKDKALLNPRAAVQALAKNNCREFNRGAMAALAKIVLLETEIQL